MQQKEIAALLIKDLDEVRSNVSMDTVHIAQIQTTHVGIMLVVIKSTQIRPEV